MLTNFVSDEKSMLRRRMAALAATQAPAAVAEQLLASQIWQTAASVGLYVNLPTEADTAPLLNGAWQAGKIVYLPKITDLKGRKMEFRRCDSFAELIPGSFGLQEPSGDHISSHVDLLVIPGVAFDGHGNRLGHGAGFYDRFLAAKPQFTPLRLGFCSSWQLLPHIPAEPWDVPMQAICTEEALLWP